MRAITIRVVSIASALAVCLAVIALATTGNGLHEAPPHYPRTGDAARDSLPEKPEGAAVDAVAHEGHREEIAYTYLIHVVDDADAPLSGASISHAGQLVASSGSDGACSFSRSQPGDALVTVSHSGYVSKTLKANPGGGPTLVKLERAHSLVIRTLDRQGSPVSGIAVHLEQLAPMPGQDQDVAVRSTGNSTGAVEFHNLSAGDYRVEIDAGKLVSVDFASPSPVRGSRVYRVPETRDVTVTVEPPAVACAIVEGDEVVRSWWKKRLGSATMSPGVGASLKRIREAVAKDNPGAMVTAWIPAEQVNSISLCVFFRHSGWREYDVPVKRATDKIEPLMIPAPVHGGDLTGTIEWLSENIASLPIVARQEDSGNGVISLKLEPNTKHRVPFGRYAITLAPDAAMLAEYVSIEPGAISLYANNADASVIVECSNEIDKVACHAFFQSDDMSDPQPLRGSAEVFHGEHRLASIIFHGGKEARDVWLPVGVPLKWRMRMLVHSKIRDFECETVVGRGRPRNLEVVLR